MILELLLVAAILAVVGLGIYTSMQHKSSTAVAAKSALSTSPSTTATPNPYAGWKTFCSSKTNACFKYDSSWTLAECAPVEINMQDFQNCPSAETVTVSAPNKAINVEWFLDPYDASKTDTCTQGKTSFPGTSYSDITQVPKTPNLYFLSVKDSGSSSYDYTGFLALTTGSNGQPPTVGQSGAICPPGPSFLSQDGKFKITFNYSYDVNTNPDLTAAQQIAPPSQADLNSVKQTLLSYYYK